MLLLHAAKCLRLCGGGGGGHGGLPPKQCSKATSPWALHAFMASLCSVTACVLSAIPERDAQAAATVMCQSSCFVLQNRVDTHPMCHDLNGSGMLLFLPQALSPTALLHESQAKREHFRLHCAQVFGVVQIPIHVTVPPHLPIRICISICMPTFSCTNTPRAVTRGCVK